MCVVSNTCGEVFIDCLNYRHLRLVSTQVHCICIFVLMCYINTNNVYYVHADVCSLSRSVHMPCMGVWVRRCVKVRRLMSLSAWS